MNMEDFICSWIYNIESLLQVEALSTAAALWA
jgi:hypothetical protein